ncbi:hypothetical protein CCP3SC15_710016 [Gammaproteobacteria bacterium]
MFDDVNAFFDNPDLTETAQVAGQTVTAIASSINQTPEYAVVGLDPNAEAAIRVKASAITAPLARRAAVIFRSVEYFLLSWTYDATGATVLLSLKRG